MTRLEKIALMLKDSKIDCALITGMENCCYATGFVGLEGMVFITAGGDGYCFTDSRYIEAATAAIAPMGYKVIEADKSYPACAAELCKKYGVTTVGFEDLNMCVAQHESYKKELPATLVPLENRFDLLREVKEEQEVRCIELAQRIAESAFDDILGVIKPDMRETEVAAELEYFMAKYGSSGLSFSTILVSGAKTSLPHGVPGDKKIEKGDFVTMDFGAMYGGYHSDMTRTIAIGSVSDEQRAVYDVVLRAQKAGVDAMAVGASGIEVDAAARDIITDAGYGKYFGHGLGHSLGLNIHENPRASKTGTALFKMGNIITIEPGIYLPGKFGVRIEDMVYLGENGKRNLTKAPRELIIV